MKEERVVCSVCKKKSDFPIVEELDFCIDLFPDYCPDTNWIKKGGNLPQVCPKCGYTATRVDECLCMSKEMVALNEYKYPLGNCSNQQAEHCFRAGLGYQAMSCPKTAAIWYMRAAVLLEDEEQKKICYKKAFLCLNSEIERRKKEISIECILAFFNLARLLEMYSITEHESISEDYELKGISKILAEKIQLLGKNRDNRYLTYMEMLSLK